MDGIAYKKLNADEFGINSLDKFQRLQKVEQCWRLADGCYKLMPVLYTEDWNADELKELAQRMNKGLSRGNIIYGAMLNGETVGFAYLDTNFRGSKNQYIVLEEFYVSAPYRRQGVGRRLFNLACGEAKQIGAQKLYISAHSAKESIAAYTSYGCTFAEEIIKELAEKEPCDLQLEYGLLK